MAKQLLGRYGVVLREILEREGALAPWRELLAVYRAFAARGEPGTGASPDPARGRCGRHDLNLRGQSLEPGGRDHSG